MRSTAEDFRAEMESQAYALLDAVEAAEAVIVTTIERECEALRAGRMLAAKALHTRLTDAARLYIDATRAARASLAGIERILPGARDFLEARRLAFGPLLKVELAVLAAERTALGLPPAALDFAGLRPAAGEKQSPARTTPRRVDSVPAKPGKEPAITRILARRRAR